MKHYILSLLFCCSAICVLAQTKGKPPVGKHSGSPKNAIKGTNDVLTKAPYLQRTFLLDRTVFTAKEDTTGSGSKSLSIKILPIKSASISITNASASSIEEFGTDMTRSFRQYTMRPDDAGFIYNKIYTSKAEILYNKAKVEMLEYKMIYQGTFSQREPAKAMNSMPKARDLNEKPGTGKPINEFDTDENNRVTRIYMLPYTPGEDKGFMMLYYEANYDGCAAAL